MNTFDLILGNFEKYSERSFLIDGVTGEKVTYGQMYSDACAIAADLRRRGLKKGDRVACFAENSLSLARLYFGILFAGGVTVPVSTNFIQSDVDFIIEKASPGFIFLSESTAKQLDPVRLTDSGLRVLYLLDRRYGNTVPESCLPYDPIALPREHDYKPFEGMQDSDPLAVVFTSGTTGRPSGIRHRIASLFGNGFSFCQLLGIGPENRFYGILSMTYLGGYYNLLLLPFAGGASIVIERAFNAASAMNFWSSAIKHGVNTLWLVPTIISILLEMDRGKQGESFCRESVILSIVGTAPLPSPIRKAFEKRYGIVLYENYGLSETFFISSHRPSEQVIERSVGRLLPQVEVRIGSGLEPHQSGDYHEGEIFVSTPFLMEGCEGEAKLSVEETGGRLWFPTGDIGYLTSDRVLFITGRKKDLIIKGGVNVSPLHIEEILHQHPGVAACAVVGVPHRLYGEDVAAVFCLKEGYDFQTVEKELIEIAEKKINSASRPAFYLVIDQMPRSSAGKIQKGILRELLKRKLNLSDRSVPSGGQDETKRIDAARSSAFSVAPRVRTHIERPSKEVVQEFQQLPASMVSDCLNRLGYMHMGLRNLTPGRRFAGTAITVEEVEGGNLMVHAALELLQPGDVLVVDAKGSTSRSCLGGLQLRMAQLRLAAAVVVYGCIRDMEELDRLSIPVFALGAVPAGPLKGWAGNINYPVSCAGAVVLPGDIVVGDDDGVVVVPSDLATEVLAQAKQRQEMEKRWFEQVEKGVATLDAVNLRKKLEEFHISYE